MSIYAEQFSNTIQTSIAPSAAEYLEQPQKHKSADGDYQTAAQRVSLYACAVNSKGGRV